MRFRTTWLGFGLLSAFLFGGDVAWADSKIWVLFVIDTNANKVGADTGPGCVASADQLKKVLSETFQGKEHRYDTATLTGESINKSQVLETIRDFNTGSDDTIWFYYCGHGANDSETGEYLATSEGDIDNDEIREALTDKGVRLSVITTEKCSSPGNFSFQAPRPTPAVWEIFNQLFFQHRGVTEITAATAPQFGWINRARGGFFTQAMASVFCDQIANVDSNDSGFVTWEEAFAAIQSRTENLFTDARLNALKYDEDAEIGKASAQTPNSYSFADTDRPEDGDIRHHKDLRVINNTGETLCVWVRCYSYDDGDWAWRPGTESSWSYELAPGEAAFLNPGSGGGSLSRVSGHAFEVWGNSGASKFAKNYFEVGPKSGYRALKDLTYNYNMWSSSRNISDVTSNTTHNVYRNGKKGMLIELAFTSHFLKETEVRFNALFFNRDTGAPLTDSNGSYKTSDGQVGVATKFKPLYLHTEFSSGAEDSVELFLPYDELDYDTDNGQLRGMFKVHADVDGESVFSSTTENYFTYGKSD